MIALVIAGAGALGVVVWVLAKLGKALITIAEALAAAAAVLVVVWLVIKAVLSALRQVLPHWRTSLTVIALGAWWHWWGWASLILTTGVIAGVLTGWRLTDLESFDAWAGRHLRAWWLRWTIYAPKLPQWLHACGLSITPESTPVVVTVNPLGRSIRRGRRPVPARLPQVLGVRSGASWDEVRIHLVPGQKPEDFDEGARALACARGVTRCQIRELSPNVVSIDFQRRNLLTDPVTCRDLAELAGISGGGGGSAAGVGRAHRVRAGLARVLDRRSHLDRGCDRGGQELGDVVPAGLDRPGDPGRVGAGLGDRP